MQSHFRWSLNDQRHPFEMSAFAESGRLTKAGDTPTLSNRALLYVEQFPLWE
jgi:hypothetical protein